MPDSNCAYDAIVIGGGPAGTTAAALLADHGHRVLVLEKSAFPRHHIGESLMPHTYWTFKRLGVLDKLKRSDFVRKQSVQFVAENGKDSDPYFFTDRDPGEWSVTWQVPRDRFDGMMLENAREKGAEILQPATAGRVLFDGTRAMGVRAEVDGRECDYHCRVVVDATGMAALLSNQRRLRYADPQLKNAAIYSYYKNAQVDEGRNAGATIVIHTPGRQGWFWFIPLPGDLASVGVVAPPSCLTTGRGGDPARTLAEEIENCPGIRRRLEQSERIAPVYVCADFSYRSRQMAGDGWVLVGDAFAFLDPVYSSGLMLALKSGEFAADAIHEALEAGDVSGARLGRFAPRFALGVQLLRQLVYAFYDKEFSFARFLKAHPEYRDHLVRLLIGDVFNDEVAKIFEAMSNYTDLPAPLPLEGAAPA